MVLRTADSVLSLALLALVVNVLGADVSWAPYVLALGSLIDGAVIRWLVLLPLRREEGDASLVSTAAPHRKG
jgi:hypothetical protein